MNSSGNILMCVVPSASTPSNAVVSLVTGFNLLGNSTNTTLDVGTTFGDATKVNTVWKWVASMQT